MKIRTALKKLHIYAPSITALFVCAVLLCNPARYSACALNALNLWALTVIPSLLPFLFLSLFLSSGNLFPALASRLTPAGKFLYKADGTCVFIQLMSAISGYPVGAKLIAELGEKKVIDGHTATKAAIFCSTSGPAFIAGSVGTAMLGSPKCGAILLISHILSSVLSGIIFRNYCDYRPIAPLFTKNEQNNPLAECARSSAAACLSVGTLICFFYVTSTLVSDLKLLAPLEYALGFLFNDRATATAFLSGIIECTTGCNALARCDCGYLKLPLISAIIAFGGVSVLAQSIAFLKQANVKIKVFAVGKAVQSILAFFICFLLQFA